jgi:hypothetical protein
VALGSAFGVGLLPFQGAIPLEILAGLAAFGGTRGLSWWSNKA